MYKVLKNKNFSILLVGGSISLLGTLMQSFALSLYVLAKTGSAIKFASILALTTIPKLIFAPIAGYVADKVDKKKWMVLLDCFSGFATCLFGLMFLIKGQWSMIDIYVVVIVLAIISTFSSPIDGSTRPLIIKKEDLVEANSLLNTAETVINVSAAILGGIIYGIFGIVIITVINGVSFFILAIMESFILIPKIEEDKKPKNIVSGIKEGFIFVKNDRKILLIGLVGAFMNFTLSSISVGMIIIGTNLLNLEPWELGMFETAGIVGSLIGASIVPTICKKMNLERIIYFTSVMMGGFFCIFGLWIYVIIQANLNKLLSFISILLFMIIIVAIVTVLAITTNTFAQTMIPKEMMGRVSSSLGIMMLSSKPLGDMFYGTTFDKIGFSISYFSAAIIMGVVSYIQKRNLTKIETSDIIMER